MKKSWVATSREQNNGKFHLTGYTPLATTHPALAPPHHIATASLASHTWYKISWEYLDHFNITLKLDDAMIVPPVRERDRVVMEEVVKTIDRSEWVAINHMRKKMKIYFFSQLSHCDGI
eukprot:scaffold21570_cov43-Cyclotella_meneghiniana.AAC.1